MNVGGKQLAALALLGLQAVAMAASPAPCGCTQFALGAAAGQTIKATPAPAALSEGGRALRDFVLFSHRRIGADLIRSEGPYLSTLSASFPHCTDAAVKLAWLRETFAATSETPIFADRVARQFDNSRACKLPQI
jgi:hypothetical protein